MQPTPSLGHTTVFPLVNGACILRACSLRSWATMVLVLFTELVKPRAATV